MYIYIHNMQLKNTNRVPTTRNRQVEAGRISNYCYHTLDINITVDSKTARQSDRLQATKVIDNFSKK